MLLQNSLCFHSVWKTDAVQTSFDNFIIIKTELVNITHPKTLMVRDARRGLHIMMSATPRALQQPRHCEGKSAIHLLSTLCFVGGTARKTQPGFVSVCQLVCPASCHVLADCHELVFVTVFFLQSNSGRLNI